MQDVGPETLAVAAVVRACPLPLHLQLLRCKHLPAMSPSVLMAEGFAVLAPWSQSVKSRSKVCIARLFELALFCFAEALVPRPAGRAGDGTTSLSVSRLVQQMAVSRTLS